MLLTLSTHAEKADKKIVQLLSTHRSAQRRLSAATESQAMIEWTGAPLHYLLQHRLAFLCKYQPPTRPVYSISKTHRAAPLGCARAVVRDFPSSGRSNLSLLGRHRSWCSHLWLDVNWGGRPKLWVCALKGAEGAFLMRVVQWLLISARFRDSQSARDEDAWREK